MSEVIIAQNTAVAMHTLLHKSLTNPANENPEMIGLLSPNKRINNSQTQIHTYILGEAKKRALIVYFFFKNSGELDIIF